MSKTVPKIEIRRLHFKCQQQQRRDEIQHFVEEWNNDSPYFTVQTSGSTGLPKSLQLSKKCAVASAEMTGSYFNYKTDDCLALGLALSGIGAKMQLIRAACFGMDLSILDTERNPLEQLMEPVKQISVVPLQLRVMLEQSPEKLHLLGSILAGGATIEADLRQKIIAAGLSVYESYGMSETYSHVALRKVEANNNLFTALPGVHFTAPDDKLCIHAPHLEIAALQTNDLVTLHNESSFTWLGRADFAINSGAFKFLPEILEQKLAASIDCFFFIAGEADETYGERVTLIAEAHYSEELLHKLESSCKELLTRYEIPKKYYFVPEFVRTETGKLNRLKTQLLAFES